MMSEDVAPNAIAGTYFNPSSEENVARAWAGEALILPDQLIACPVHGPHAQPPKEERELRMRCVEAAAQIMRGTGYKGAGGSEWDRTDKNVIELASALLDFVKGKTP